MKEDGGVIVTEYRKYKVYFYIAIASLVTLYGLSLIVDLDLAIKLNREDGLVENLSALAFFTTAIIFFILFIRTRHLINLLFALVFIFGAGEEISWGQRLLNFEVPEALNEINAQDEFNIHNLNVFNSVDDDGAKQGISRFLGFNTLFFLFCLFYGILLPAFFMKLGFVRKIVERIHLPVPPLILGIFFLLNYLIFKSISLLYVPDESFLQFSSVIDESKELGWAIIFLLITITFLYSVKKPRKKIEA